MWIGFFVSASLLAIALIGVLYYIWEEYYKDKKDSFEERQKNRYFAGVSKEQVKKAKKISILASCFFIVIYLGLVTAFSSIGAMVENKNFCAEVEKYKASKYTIETSMKNDDLTGFERIELVKQATEKNEWLASAKYRVNIWYNFHLDKSVLELEMINLNE